MVSFILGSLLQANGIGLCGPVVRPVSVRPTAAEQHSTTGLLGGVWKAVGVAAPGVLKASESDALCNVSVVVGQHLDPVIVRNEHPLLLELIEVPEAGKALLRERKKFDIFHRAASLADEEGVSLKR